MIIPKNAKDVAGMREFVGGIKAQFCSLQSVYQGEIRKLIDAVVASADAVLSKLPTGEVKSDWNADDALQCLCGCLSSANAVLTQVSLELNKLQQSMASAVTTEIEKEIKAGNLFRKDGVTPLIEAEITSRKLVTPESVNQLCSSAKEAGSKEGRAALQAEIDAKAVGEKIINDRKTALTAAGKAVPHARVESILRLAEEGYKAEEAKFDQRVQKLTAAGYTSLSPALLSHCWGTDAQFAEFEEMIAGIPALKQTPPEPLAGGTQTSHANKGPLIA